MGLPQLVGGENGGVEQPPGLELVGDSDSDALIALQEQMSSRAITIGWSDELSGSIRDAIDVTLGVGIFYDYIQKLCEKLDKSMADILYDSQKKFLVAGGEFHKKDKIRLLLLESIIERFSESEENIRKFLIEGDDLENVFNKTMDVLIKDLLEKKGDYTGDIRAITNLSSFYEHANSLF